MDSYQASGYMSFLVTLHEPPTLPLPYLWVESMQTLHELDFELSIDELRCQVFLRSTTFSGKLVHTCV